VHDETTQLAAAIKEAMKKTGNVIRPPREPLEETAALLARCLGANPNFVDHFSQERACSQVSRRLG
jgi:hypothetical protein